MMLEPKPKPRQDITLVVCDELRDTATTKALQALAQHIGKIVAINPDHPMLNGLRRTASQEREYYARLNGKFKPIDPEDSEPKA